MSESEKRPGRGRGEASFERLKAEFKKTFGLPFPAVFLPDPHAEPISSRSDEGLAFSTTVKRGAFPFMADIFERAPVGTWLAGFWGYGANSYAWYFVRKDARREVFLRLGYGGFYTDNREAARAVREFTERYVAFERWAQGRLERWHIENTMGECSGWVQRVEGTREALASGPEREFRFPNEAGHPGPLPRAGEGGVEEGESR